MRGYFGIGIYGGKTVENVGTLWRSAYQFGATEIFTIAGRYKRQITDTYSTPKHIPLRQYLDIENFILSLPYDCMLVGVEFSETSLVNFEHPERACYVLGAEDTGLPMRLQHYCHKIVSIPFVREQSYNVATAGSIVMYDRFSKQLKKIPKS